MFPTRDVEVREGPGTASGQVESWEISLTHAFSARRKV